MPLVTESSIKISNKVGTCQLELCLGDITDLSPNDIVDIVMVSAFPGEYKSKKGTLINALKNKLDIDVASLAGQKDLDLRKLFSCWKSAQLPDGKPFRKLVCFEENTLDDAKSLKEQVARIFGAMMLLLTDSETSVITPILATGVQNQPFLEIFDAMVASAIAWIKAGLPLTCIKLVLYSGNVQEDRKAMYKQAISSFNETQLKEQGTQILRMAEPVQKHKTKCVKGKTYKLTALLGRGGTSKVYKALDEADGGVRAIKIVDLAGYSANVVDAFLKETALLEKLGSCGQVIKLYDWNYEQETQKLIIVLEYGDTDLKDFLEILNYLNPTTVQYFWKNMVYAVEAMHDEGVVHTDLKPANFVLVKGSIKLCDFGIAESLQRGMTSVFTNEKKGTPHYMSPEALTNCNASAQDFQFKISKRSDVWSLGCILYEMVYGKTPFEDQRDENHAMMAIVRTSHIIPFPHIEDHELLDVMKKCLVREKDKRPTTQELLKHPYLNRTHT